MEHQRFVSAAIDLQHLAHEQQVVAHRPCPIGLADEGGHRALDQSNAGEGSPGWSYFSCRLVRFRLKPNIHAGSRGSPPPQADHSVGLTEAAAVH